MAPSLLCSVGTVEVSDAHTGAVLGQESPCRSNLLRNLVAGLKLCLKRDSAQSRKCQSRAPNEGETMVYAQQVHLLHGTVYSSLPGLPCGSFISLVHRYAFEAFSSSIYI